MHPASRTLFILSPVAQAVSRLAFHATLGLACAVSAQTLPVAPASAAQASSPLRLQSTPMLSEAVPDVSASELPTFLSGERITGRPNLETVIEGDGELRRGTTAIRADRIEYYQPDDLLKTRGNVRVNRAGNRFAGPEMQVELDRFEGFFTSPTYRFLSNGGNGQAERVDFIDDKHMTARTLTYTTCERGNEESWKPAWVMSAKSIDFDFEQEVGVATNAVVRFKEVPILAFPSLSFPLSSKRKSGLLPPTIAMGGLNGFELGQPYYFDIAPNRDATFSPRFMSKRGIDFGGEFRYLEPTYQGQLRANYLPGDKLRGKDRWSYALQHSGTINTGLSAVGGVGLNLNLNRASDNDYWRDFSTPGLTTQRLLPQDATLSWSRGFFSSSVRTLKWQTLQDVTQPITPPYDLLPQLQANYSRVDAPLLGMGSGFDWSANTEYTRFSADSRRTGQPNAERALTKLSVSRPYLAAAGYITPKLQLHATRYQFDAPLADGTRTQSRVVPTFSLDAGLQFEREALLFGRAFTQTLEPRAFYVRTPYREQNQLPNYDSGANSFNFASLFTENAFVGQDRISDANLVTVGLTSRLLDKTTGAETARFGVAQRLRFEDQRVTLPGGLPVSDRVSDLLAGASINWVPQWSFDTLVQYNPKTQTSERSSVGVRYNPGPYRVLTAALRRQRNLSHQLDVGWQWPLNGLWEDSGSAASSRGSQPPGGRYYAVGRMNYSLSDKRLVDSLIGLEYDGCCWVGRVVLQRTQSSLNQSNTQILFQLELVGFSRLGTDAVGALKTHVPRYQPLHQTSERPSRFTTYD